jgi:hypothetical protein
MTIDEARGNTDAYMNIVINRFPFPVALCHGLVDHLARVLASITCVFFSLFTLVQHGKSGLNPVPANYVLFGPQVNIPRDRSFLLDFPS